ncbi:MAG: hypothetical protein KKB81_08395 [Candidatus Margulisbacteria bacterium]|nr:hypothetical protein [Candidatus Margulisiibacteriota bacterium]
MKTYYIKTFGCQMNVNDSEILAGFGMATIMVMRFFAFRMR